MFLADGPVLLGEALAAGAEVEAVFAEPEALGSPPVRAAASAGVPVRPVDDGVLARVLDVVTPQHVVAVVRRPVTALAAVLSAGEPEAPLLVLVGLQDPGNAGTLVRVAEAAGCRGVVLSTGSVDVTNPKTVRATAGSLFRVPVAEGLEPTEVLEACHGAGLRTLAAVRGDAAAPEELDLTVPVALVVGSEAHGLPAEVAAACDAGITIPMAGRVDSLNAGIAGAVVLFEAARQRRAATAAGRGPATEWPTTGSAGPQ